MGKFTCVFAIAVACLSGCSPKLNNILCHFPLATGNADTERTACPVRPLSASIRLCTFNLRGRDAILQPLLKWRHKRVVANEISRVRQNPRLRIKCIRDDNIIPRKALPNKSLCKGSMPVRSRTAAVPDNRQTL